MLQIDSHFHIRGEFDASFDQDTVKNEPMLFNCDAEAAYNLGGPITKNFLDHLPEDWKNVKIVADSRVHMLKKRWLPCIGGYHTDDVPRTAELNWQPNFVDPAYRSNHIMGLVNGKICPTQFVVGKFELEIPPPTQITYQVWHREVEALVQAGKVETSFAESGKYIEFDDRSFHQGTLAVADGWRWFIRLSKDTDRVNRCTNELRRQVQVYLDITEGW